MKKRLTSRDVDKITRDDFRGMIMDYVIARQRAIYAERCLQERYKFFRPNLNLEAQLQEARDEAKSLENAALEAMRQVVAVSIPVTPEELGYSL